MDASTSHDTVLSAAARGDDGALELLVRAYHDRVYRFGLRVCRDAFDADDAVQEAFAKLARRPDVARDPGVLSWLMTAVRNACLRMLRPFARERSRLGQRADDVDAVASGELDPQAALERWRLVRAVHEAIAALERPYREVLVLRDVEGLTGDEVCQMLGLGEAAMKSRLHRARQLVRAEVLRREGASSASSASSARNEGG
ncbi:sigma-70 family RNA polymerase sigma factor [Sorangium sp. So ce260]|uniref:RNA polymerase sigma factor n=1 Tax=Sorangium sp. So ce260 TaxID=3133291 RepID=UPI003F5F0F9D